MARTGKLCSMPTSKRLKHSCWMPSNCFLATYCSALLLLSASLPFGGAFILPRGKYATGGVQLHAPSVSVANSGSITRVTAAATPAGNLEFRSPKLTDVDPVADLLVECFETELKWFEFPEKESRRKRYRDMLQQSFLRRIGAAQSPSETCDKMEDFSFMLMVEDSSAKQAVGFVQLGGLPPPLGFPTMATTTAKTGLATDQKETTWNEIPVKVSPQQPRQQGTADVPYIANLCVLPPYRKTGIGKKMVGVCMRWLEKKYSSNSQSDIDGAHVFLAVESGNLPAKRFWEHIGFSWIAPPDEGSKKPAAATRDYYFRSLYNK